MSGFHYREGQLYAEEVPLSRLAREFGTPIYVYSRLAIEQAWQTYDAALAHHRHLICYSVKANSNLAILNTLAQLGSGFDIVSGGELARVLMARGDPAKVVFSGVGKTTEEIDQALAADIKCFNIESISELERIEHCARHQGRAAPVAMRINPDIDPETHPHIATGLRKNKFGISYQQALEAYEIAAGLKHIQVAGVACHIGSQIRHLKPFMEAMAHLMDLVHTLEKRGIHLQHIDAGGGLGIAYGREESAPTVRQYINTLMEGIPEQEYEIIVEPGRSIVATAGVLLTRTEYVKHTDARDFAIVDAGMNDLMRPALYDGWHDVLPVHQDNGETEARSYDLVGPICESGDILAHDRHLALQQGDLLAITVVGAYGFSMSSNYNTRPRPCELLVDGQQTHLIRRRETIQDLVAGETMPPGKAVPVQ